MCIRDSHEYYAYPFYKGITEGGSRAFMAAYNSWNGSPMSIHPCLEEITRKQWGNLSLIHIYKISPKDNYSH